MDVLEKIVASKRTELEAEKRQVPMRRAIELASSAPPPHSFGATLRNPGRLNVIAEVKRASPSRGEIRGGADPADVARSYARAGAAAI
jgi:indole-3-glycerol phosphate synthase